MPPKPPKPPKPNRRSFSERRELVKARRALRSHLKPVNFFDHESYGRRTRSHLFRYYSDGKKQVHACFIRELNSHSREVFISRVKPGGKVIVPIGVVMMNMDPWRHSIEMRSATKLRSLLRSTKLPRRTGTEMFGVFLDAAKVWARKEGVRMIVLVADNASLVNYYSSFGFKMEKDSNQRMFLMV